MKMISLPLCLCLSLFHLFCITQPPPIVLCATTSSTSRDKQPAKSDGLCSTEEMIFQLICGDQNELEEQCNNTAYEPPEVPFVPCEGLEHQVLDNPLPPELQDFLHPSPEELEVPVLLDIPQLPAQSSEAPQQPVQPPPEVPQQPAQWPVFPLIPRIAPNNSHYIHDPFSSGIPSYPFPGIAPNPFIIGITPNPYSSEMAWYCSHCKPWSAEAQQPNQEDGSAPNSGMARGNNDGKVKPYGQEKRKECVERYKRKRECRNFEKKIRYVIRREVADRRLREGGRFVGNSEAEPSHRYGHGVSEPDDTGSGSGSVMAGTQQDASLQSQQELACRNNELRSQVHYQSWPNALSGSGDDHEATTLEQEQDAAGWWRSDAGGGDDHVSGQGH